MARCANLNTRAVGARSSHSGPLWSTWGLLAKSQKPTGKNTRSTFAFQEEPFDWLKVFFNFLPWLLFVGLWLFIFRQMQGGPKGAFSFGKSRAKLVLKTALKSPLTTLPDRTRPNRNSRKLSSTSRIPENSNGLEAESLRVCYWSGHRVQAKRTWPKRWPAKPTYHSTV